MAPWKHLEVWNLFAFKVFQGTPDAPAELVAAARLLTEFPVYLAVSLALYYVLTKRDAACGVAIVLAEVIARLIEVMTNLYAFHPRPFAAGFGPALVHHAANNSLPSSHATFVWTFAAIFAFRGHAALAAIMFGMGVLVAWARIFVGIHWPLDMVASAVVAAFSGGVGSILLRAGTKVLGKRK
ncbi:phosphatase PAP2 family protein [Schauerella aestuarii]|uniref:phosphatase PAP2 family protein n=1 Tax=Schauerella aestuarii TaxID=2511204 RepID=UPI00136CD99F|nr:phosphatase PAP2 family protein [Achromobacter aestuarii]